MTTRTDSKSPESFIKRRNINSEAIHEFKQMLPLVDLYSATKLQDANVTYNRFMEIFLGSMIYYFLNNKLKLKIKHLIVPR